MLKIFVLYIFSNLISPSTVSWLTKRRENCGCVLWESSLIMESKTATFHFPFALIAIILNLHLCIILNKSHWLLSNEHCELNFFSVSLADSILYIFLSIENWLKFHHKFTFHVLCFIHKSHLRISNSKLKINFEFLSI